MKTSVDLKNLVRQKYGEIAQQGEGVSTGCCGVGCGCDTVDYSVFAEDYTKLEGYDPNADLGLGCGLPTEFAKIKPGDTVVDLGSGAGNDCFVARAETGDNGRVIGVDMTEAMVTRARENAAKRGFTNVEFVLADIESMPLPDNTADVVVSNCVFNLVPDKALAFAETFRILKSGGHFSISDVVLKGSLPEGLREDAEMYAGCVSGAIPLEEHLAIIENAGFKNIQLQKSRANDLPDEILEKYLSAEDITRFRSGEVGIFSVTVYAEKP